MINLPNSQLVSLQLNISNLAIATISISELYSVLVSMVPTSLVDSPRLVSFMHKLPVTTSNAILTRGIALRFTVFGFSKWVFQHQKRDKQQNNNFARVLCCTICFKKNIF